MKFLYAILFVLLSLGASAAAPTVPASNLHFSAIDGGYFNMGWTSGNGSKRVIICKAGSAVTFVPQNGVDYAENTVFGSGQQVAPGEYVVYDNAFTSFFITGLTPATQYFFVIYEYNGSGVSTEYLTASFLSGSATTSATPSIQVSNASFSNISTNSVTVSWTNGNGTRRLVVAREGSPVTADPVNSQPYNVNSSFGSGATIGAGNFTIYNSSGNSTSLTNLRPGTEYFLAIYEFNGSSQPQYKTPACTASFTTRSIPTVASSNIVITKTDGKELSLSWTNGNGQRRIIVAKQGSNIISVPANGTDYAASSVFGSGQQLAPGEYVVFDDNFNAASITGLNPATTYYFRIFEYDGTGSNSIYLTSSFAFTNASTAVTPSTQATGLSATNISANSLSLSWTPGDGRARMVVAHKNAPVNFNPQDFVVYTANSDFGAGQDLGNGNFVISNSIDAFVNIHNLEANTSYHFAVFEYNGFNQPLYRLPAATGTATTLTALPVKLSRWEATPSGNKVILQWTTSAEINASHFVIERSADGTRFSPLATVPANGNTQGDASYSGEDPDPLGGRSYYRLKMVDVDGRFEYADVRTVLFSSNKKPIILGNPVRNIVELVTPNAGGRSAWQIINTAGQIMRKGFASPGRTVIDISTLNAGEYWLRSDSGERPQVLAFIKL